jgi:asparagine synthase (glutamine-hydrolysing)
MSYLAVPAPFTFFADIYKLLPGFYIRLDAHGSTSYIQWYTLHDTQSGEYKSEQQVTDHVRQLLDDAIMMRADVSVSLGAFISGGLDSTLLAAQSLKKKEQISTYHVFFTDSPELQEHEWARYTARLLHTTHYEIPMTVRNSFDVLQTIIRHTGEPVGDSTSIPLYYAAREAQKQGCKAVMIGEGADEIFCGYSVYEKYFMLNNWYALSQQYVPRFLRKFCSRAYTALTDQERLSSLIMSQWAESRALFYHSTLISSEAQTSSYIPAVAAESLWDDPIFGAFYPAYKVNTGSDLIDYHRARLLEKIPHASLTTLICYLEFMYRLPDLVLSRTDVITMACSLETRVPFLDHHLVEYVWNMPPEYKYKNGTLKYILRKAASSLVPDTIITRKKMGFSCPVKGWFQPHTVFSRYCRDRISECEKWQEYLSPTAVQNIFSMHYEKKREKSYHLWTLCNLFMALEVHGL